MLVQMTTGLSGPTLTLGPGDQHDFPQDEALRLVAAGYAVPVAERQIERAVADPIVETRTAPEPFQHRKQKKNRR